MADEFFVWTANGLDLTPRDPMAVFLVQDSKVSVTSSQKRIFDSWGRYFENNPAWREHLKSEHPLSSLFGRSTYISGDFSPYNKDTSSKYKAALKAVGGKTVVFTPRKA